MIRSATLAAVFAAAVTLYPVSALASHCPTDVSAINAALDGADLSEEARTEIMSLRDEGASLHEAGDHAASEAKLHEAMEMLGIEH